MRVLIVKSNFPLTYKPNGAENAVSLTFEKGQRIDDAEIMKVIAASESIVNVIAAEHPDHKVAAPEAAKIPVVAK